MCKMFKARGNNNTKSKIKLSKIMPRPKSILRSWHDFNKIVTIYVHSDKKSKLLNKL